MAMFLVFCCAAPTPASKDFGKCVSATAEVWVSAADDEDPIVIARSYLMDCGWEITSQPVVTQPTAEHLSQFRIDTAAAYWRAQRLGVYAVLVGAATEQQQLDEARVSQVERVIPQSKN